MDQVLAFGLKDFSFLLLSSLGQFFLWGLDWSWASINVGALIGLGVLALSSMDSQESLREKEFFYPWEKSSILFMHGLPCCTCVRVWLCPCASMRVRTTPCCVHRCCSFSCASGCSWVASLQYPDCLLESYFLWYYCVFVSCLPLIHILTSFILSQSLSWISFGNLS